LLFKKHPVYPDTMQLLYRPGYYCSEDPVWDMYIVYILFRRPCLGHVYCIYIVQKTMYIVYILFRRPCILYIYCSIDSIWCMRKYFIYLSRACQDMFFLSIFQGTLPGTCVDILSVGHRSLWTFKNAGILPQVSIIDA